MKTRGWVAAALIATSAFVPACRMGRNPSPGGTVAITVDNRNVRDVDVFLLHDGTRQRLGLALGSSTHTFAFNGGQLVSGRIRLVATPVGGTGQAASGPLNVGSGQNVTFVVQPILVNSYATVR